jgi:anti-sigma regulatory factor (Ser/Thr protein kinase)
MPRVRARGEGVRSFILANVKEHPRDIARVTAEFFGITRQAVSKHLQRLAVEGSLRESGQTRSRVYRLAPLSDWRNSYRIVPGLAEDVVWTDDVRAALGRLPDNVMLIWQHGFTEMFNNAIDHSGGTSIRVEVQKTATTAEMSVADDGVGIFRKIQAALNLLDERHAILELSKGKLTTDPKRHSGEGIFFTSRMFDSFEILSGGAYFSHERGKAHDWLLETDRAAAGTTVLMRLNNHTSRTTKKVFDAFVTGDDFDFSKTIVPVRLALYGDDKLISRSQAKRVLARVDRFRTVVFDFRDVDSIGQAFADEIFRVFATEHAQIELIPMHANSEVKRMIARATAGSRRGAQR